MGASDYPDCRYLAVGHRWSIGAVLTVYVPELAPILSGTHLPTSGGWKAELR